MFEKYIERQAEYEQTKIKNEMSDHNIHTGDSTLAGISVLSMILAILGLGTFAAVVAIISGGISIILNWDKFALKVKTAYEKLFKNKNKLP